MNPTLVMGPGRSGSRFLTDVLRSMGYCAVHEHSGRWRAEKYIDECDWEGAAEWLGGGQLRALSGFPYGLMVHYLRYKIPDLRVIAVHRPYDEWVKSAGRKDGTKVGGARGWPRNLRDKEHYWGLYEHLMLSVAPPVLHLTMAELNDCKPLVDKFVGFE